MNRATKFLAATIAVLLLGGVVAAQAVGPTATTPVTLCIMKGGTVRLPAPNTTCTSKETTFSAASPGDVAALAARADAAETALSVAQAAVAALQTENAAQAQDLTSLETENNSLAEDLDDLAARVAALEPAITTEPVDCASLECSVRIIASGLKPGSLLRIAVVREDGGERESTTETVGADGSLNIKWSPLADYRPELVGDYITATGIGWLGQPVSYDSRNP